MDGFVIPAEAVGANEKFAEGGVGIQDFDTTDHYKSCRLQRAHGRVDFDSFDKPLEHSNDQIMKKFYSSLNVEPAYRELFEVR